MIYFIADPHLGYPGVTRWRSEFKDWRDHDAAFVERWNRTVSPRDTVYILGDFGGVSSGPAGDTRLHVVATMVELNGTKHGLRGNHDDEGMLNKMLLTGGLDTLENYAEIKVQLTRGSGPSTKIVMCHYPLAAWNDAFRGSVMLHGHTHGTMVPVRGIRRLDLSAELLDLTPISQYQLPEALEARGAWSNLDTSLLADGHDGLVEANRVWGSK